jgi:hypothetical protein
MGSVPTENIGSMPNQSQYGTLNYLAIGIYVSLYLFSGCCLRSFYFFSYRLVFFLVQEENKNNY